MNKCIFIGRLTREIELKYLPSGQAVAKTGFATSKKYKDKTTGEIKEKTMFIDIVVWAKLAEIFHQNCKKGHKIGIVGELELDQWQDNDGNKRSKHTISVESFEFLEPKGSQSQPQEDEYPAQQIPGVSNPPSMDRRIDDIDEDSIPFKRG